jgi:putative nucleotidyltransferase with HDIG domain
MIQRQNEYKEITLESIEAIARTIDAKDHYTNGHSLRVGFYAREIAKEMGFKQQDVENIYYAALLHDIGKIAVPDRILNKPGHLSDDEYVVIQTHTIEGAKILSSISTIPNITYGARYHHEKYDGSGYPDGLKGDEIPLVARIICCADCYDAMATKRVYKEPYLTNKIIEEFVKCSGTQFDPEIAKVVIKLINENKIHANIDTSIEAVRKDNKFNVSNKFKRIKK